MFITRDGWGSLATSNTVKVGALPELFVHHVAGRLPSSVDDECRHMRELQAYAINTKGYSDIDYNVLVGPSGNIYEARGMRGKSAATLDRNDVSRSVCAMGNYEHDTPTIALIAGIIEAGRMMIAAGAVRPDVTVYGHRFNPAHYGATACPGRNLIPFLAQIAAGIVDITPAPPAPPKENDDMAKFVKCEDGDAAAYAVTGVIASWIDNEADLAVLVKHRTMDPDLLELWPRAHFKSLRLVGAIPPGWNAGEFREVIETG